MNEFAYIVACLVSGVGGAWVGTLAERGKNRARNAVQAQCVECAYLGAEEDVERAVHAAAGHKAATGHHAIVVKCRG